MAGPVKNPRHPRSSAGQSFLWEGSIEPLLDGVNVWLNVYDSNRNLVFWNSAAEKIGGYTRDEVLDNVPIWDWLHSDAAYREFATAKAGAPLETESEVDRFETEILCRNGAAKTISWNSRTLTDEAGGIRGAIAFGRDVTDLKPPQDALQRAQEELSVL